MTDAEQVLRENSEAVLPDSSALQSTSGYDVAEALRARMRDLAASTISKAETAINEFDSHRATATAALIAFEQRQKAAQATMDALQLTNRENLPHQVRHDRLISIERLARSLHFSVELTVKSVEEAISECGQARSLIQTYREISDRASTLATHSKTA